MKTHTLGLGIATLILVSACGGGGGSDSPSDPKAPDNQVAGAYRGKAFVVASGSQPGSINEAKNVGSDALAVLNANGKQVALQIPGVIAGSLTQINGNLNYNGKSYKLFYASGTNYRNSKFGYINDGNEDYIFSQGLPTTNMPSSGSVRYAGIAVLGKGGAVGPAPANFTADFGQKTLSADITPLQNSRVAFNPIKFNATINGNSFSTGDGAVQSTGYFYGDNARELGGVLHDSSQSLGGSFGAIRAE